MSSRMESIERQTVMLDRQIDGWLFTFNTEGMEDVLQKTVFGHRLFVHVYWDIVGERTDRLADFAWSGALGNGLWWYADDSGDIYRCCDAKAQLISDGNTISVENKTSMILIHYYWPGQSGSLWRDNAYAAMTPYIEQGYSYHSEVPYDETDYGKRYEIKLAKNPPAQ